MTQTTWSQEKCGILLFSMALTKKQNTFPSSLTVYPFQDQPGEGRRRPCSVTNSHLLRRFSLLLRLSFPSVVLRNFIKSGDRSSPQNLYFIFWFKHLNCTCLLLFFLCVVYHPSLKQRRLQPWCLGQVRAAEYRRVKRFLKKWGELSALSAKKRQVLEAKNSWL